MRKSIKFILLFLFAVFLFWFFWQRQNLTWEEVSGSILKANALYVALATLIICLGYYLRAKRWQVLLEPITETDIKELFATTTVGFTAVFFVGRMGEMVRPMWLPMRDKRVRPSAALVTLLLERFFDLAAVIAFFSVNLIWFNVPVQSEGEFRYIKFVGYIMFAAAVSAFVGLVVYHRYSAYFIGLAEKITGKKFFPRRVRRIIISLMRQLASALNILQNWREIVRAAFWTTMLWLSIAVPTWLVMLAFNLEKQLTISDALFIMGFAAIGSLIPTPGGAAGGFHAVTAKGLMLLGVAAKDAAAVSIVMHLVYFAPALIFGFYYFFHGDISVKQFRELISSEHAAEEVEHERDKKIDSGQWIVANEESSTDNGQLTTDKKVIENI